MSSQAEAVTFRLQSTWEKWWTFSLLTGMVLAGAISFGLLVLFVLADALWRLPQGVLGGFFVVWAGVTGGLVVLLVARLLRFRRSLEATARRVEIAFPELGSHLINLVQLGTRDGVNGEDPFRKAALDQAAQAVAEFPFDRAAERESRWGRFKLCMQTPRDLMDAVGVLAAVLALGGILHLSSPAWVSSTRRVLHPWQFVPATGAVKILKVTPGDTEVLVGSRVDVGVQLAEALPASSRAVLYARTEGGPEEAIPLHVSRDGKTGSARMPEVTRALEYRVEVGDTQSERFLVGVYQKPAVETVAVTYEFPAYVGRPPLTIEQKDGDLEAPQFTMVRLEIMPNTAISRGYLQVGETRVLGTVGDGGKTLLAELLLKESMSYAIHLETASGHTDEAPRANQVRILSDAAPVVRIIEPAREKGVAVGGEFDVVVRAGDDYGLGEVRLEVKTGGGEGQESQEPAIERVANWTSFSGEGTAAQVHHRLVLEGEKYRPGVSLALRAVARDRRAVDRPELKLGPQEVATEWLPIRVLDPKQEATAELARVQELRVAVAKILQQQVRARLATSGVPRAASLEQARAGSASVRALQVEIQQTTTALAEAPASGGTDEDSRMILRVLRKLAFNEMLEAVGRAETLERGETLERLEGPALGLAETQDQIIDGLRRLLNELRGQTDGLLAAMEKRPETTLPTDVEDKLRALRDQLQEFLKQQKKVIEATENLAKKPVEDFTEEEGKELAALVATEDEWSKFLADQRSDLSKLPEQDFSNPSLLAELIAVETEIKMAKDALTKKTVDIAVPLEQLGAEMAAELTTNIEKWLPETPDRERWSQEEPLTDEMKEAPMAELPQELEDLVGDLMEEEEDLFDEMEDISSSWADSLDKGAGWDALDGPISNMSARGVTGNRLPNTSEIGGRSGEGRSGKSSGEFVSEEAVGKGGRRTPTRLTPDAFVKGEVKDTSKDPVGGATGGGKTSGYGGEGLQGPVPDRAQNPLARLANRQASLRNKAEAVDLKFQVMRFQHADLKRLIGQMAGVEQDLRGGLYQNALRRREVVLDGLGQVKMFLEGEFVIRQDRTVNLPGEIQKDIMGSMGEPSPEGWEELNRRYFERLSGGGPAAGEVSRPAASAGDQPVDSPPVGTASGDGG